MNIRIFTDASKHKIPFFPTAVPGTITVRNTKDWMSFYVGELHHGKKLNLSPHKWKIIWRFGLSVLAMHLPHMKKVNFHPKLHQSPQLKTIPQHQNSLLFYYCKEWSLKNWSHIQNLFYLCSPSSSQFRNAVLRFLPHAFEIFAAMNIIPSVIISADTEKEEGEKSQIPTPLQQI